MAMIDSISRAMGKVSYMKPIKKLGEKFAKDPEKALGNAVVTSIILKDGIGCAMYVTQSLHNKKIPDEKRKFVAALDLTNGGLMILAQIAMFVAMRKYSGPMFKKLYNKSFGELARFENIERFRMNAAKTGKDIAKRLKIEKVYDKVEKDGLDLFKFVLDTSAATIIGKRVIVPLIATPFAKKVEKWMGKDDIQSDETNASTTQEPSMQGSKLDVTSTQSGTTNLLEQYKKQNA